ncbi:MAG: nucleotide exchange factor GrpE [Gemmatimonadetes bacterium]|nr:nucleotide exchange factor GrpE [Gemmatimonadota bacterium]
MKRTKKQKPNGGLEEGIDATSAEAPEAGDPTEVAEDGTAPDAVAAEDTPGHIDEVAAPDDEELEPEAELAVLRDRHLRLAAEFDNFRRRTRKELFEAGERARAELAGELLEVLDDLQRVADTPCEGTTTEALHQGTELVAKKLTKTLADAGMEAVNPLGERFDPNLHEAILVAPTDDESKDETVSQVVRIGYRLGDRLLRPAQVGVFRHEEESA